tara:strand:- start:870 stop:1907 length:1038 start_codon:yes stop_codon:yes gene_type:complete
LPEDAYVTALIDDLKQDAELAQGRRLTSIFFGGGTPSLFSASAIEKIIAAAQGIIGCADNTEITLEANPGTFEQQKFIDYKHCGVNRLSIGVQSFNDQQLQALGRMHSGDNAIRAVATAKTAGFDNINLDLMHGLPAQTPAQALADVHQAIALAPSHLSWYQLTIEPNTAFYSAPPSLPEEDLLQEIQAGGLALLTAAGFAQYEVSAFAKPGRQARHNINYWQFGDYLGIGAGAHSKVTMLTTQQIQRCRKTRHPRDYLGRTGDYLAGTRTLDKAELPVEFLMNALRLNAGVPRGFYTPRTGLDFEDIGSAWQALEQEGLVSRSTQNLAVTPLGQRFLDTVLARL